MHILIEELRMGERESILIGYRHRHIRCKRVYAITPPSPLPFPYCESELNSWKYMCIAH